MVATGDWETAGYEEQYSQTCNKLNDAKKSSIFFLSIFDWRCGVFSIHCGPWKMLRLTTPVTATIIIWYNLEPI